VTLSADKLILVSICLLVFVGFVYSVGVERGKRAMEATMESLMPTLSEKLKPAKNGTLKVTSGEESVVSQEETILVVGRQNALDDYANAGVEGTEVVLEIESSRIPVADTTRKDDYTVQLVTYQTEKGALEEVAHLKKGGHEAFVIPSGKYFQVCADYFNSKTDAKSILKQFQASGRYSDAFIRPVVR